MGTPHHRLDRWPGNQRGKQRHHDQGHEHAFANQASAQGEDAENNFHGAAGVHGQADGPGGAGVHAAEARSPTGAENFSQAGDGDERERHPETEVGGEVGAQADAGEKKRGENVGDDLTDVGGDGSPGGCGFAAANSRFLDSAGSLARFGCVRNDRVFYGNDNIF